MGNGDLLYIWYVGCYDWFTVTRIPSSNPSLTRAASWLEHIQHEDGGWGESCHSSVEKRFVTLPFSTPSQTAWALDALISYYDTETPAIRKGVSYLLSNPYVNERYPTGTGLPGAFYIRYHSYAHIYPLLTLAHYIKNIENKPRDISRFILLGSRSLLKRIRLCFLIFLLTGVFDVHQRHLHVRLLLSHCGQQVHERTLHQCHQ